MEDSGYVSVVVGTDAGTQTLMVAGLLWGKAPAGSTAEVLVSSQAAQQCIIP